MRRGRGRRLALTGRELTLARHTLTDLLDDLAGCGDPELRDAIAVDVRRHGAELHLAAHRAWTGTSKCLVRELRQLVETTGGDVTERPGAGLRAALSGQVGPLQALAEEILDQVGGRLWAGLRLAAPDLTAPRQASLSWGRCREEVVGSRREPTMSKVDAQRAMREARYLRNRASGPTRREAAAAAGAPPTVATPTTPAVPTPSTKSVPVGAATAVAAGELCGHKSMNGRACTRETGHPEKTHRYG